MRQYFSLANQIELAFADHHKAAFHLQTDPHSASIPQKMFTHFAQFASRARPNKSKRAP
jgi:hypothetical protein